MMLSNRNEQEGAHSDSLHMKLINTYTEQPRLQHPGPGRGFLGGKWLERGGKRELLGSGDALSF